MDVTKLPGLDLEKEELLLFNDIKQYRVYSRHLNNDVV